MGIFSELEGPPMLKANFNLVLTYVFHSNQHKTLSALHFYARIEIWFCRTFAEIWFCRFPATSLGGQKKWHMPIITSEPWQMAF